MQQELQPGIESHMFDRRHTSFIPGQQYRTLDGKLVTPVAAKQHNDVVVADTSYLAYLCRKVGVGWCNDCQMPEYQAGMAHGGKHVCQRTN